MLLTLMALGSVQGCLFLKMTSTDNIPVENHTGDRVHILVNHHYPDTSLAQARVNSYIAADQKGAVVLVNREWRRYLAEREAVTVFFAEWHPPEFYDQWKPEQLNIYGKIILTLPKLDSLGWVLTVPPES